MLSPVILSANRERFLAFADISNSSASSILCDKYLDSQQNSMIKKYGAQETYFEA